MNAYAGLDPCVHCGFCLQSCPTYLATGDESDGPRGRIVLMQALRGHRLDPTDTKLAYHLDRCLGCRACEPVCPSGVAYGPALEQARSELANIRPIPLAARVVNRVMSERLLRRAVFQVAKAVRPVASDLAGQSRIGFALGMLAATKFEPGNRRPAVGPRTMGELADVESASEPQAIVFRGCIMDELFSHVHAATERTLRTNGIATGEAPGQSCCGALHAHSGQHEAAVRLARKNVAAFAETSSATIVVNSAGCGAMLKEYGSLLSGDPLEASAQRLASRVRDVTEVLAERGPRRGAPLHITVAYDPPCHLLHAQRVDDAPRKVLEAVPELEQLQHLEADMCCGSAGSYSLTEPDMSREILSRKIQAIRDVAPNVVATGNPGCVMQIGAGLAAEGLEVPVVHPLEILDWSYRKAGFYARETKRS